MMLEEPAAEIGGLQQRQERQNKHWLRWGIASNIAGAILLAAVALQVAWTGDDPPLPMIFIALMFSFAGVAFTTVGRLLALPRLQQSSDSPG